MHGYEPGSVHPTTDLVLSHKHPDDYGQVAATLDEIRRTSGAFSTRHRIIDTHGDDSPRRRGRRPALRRRGRGDRHPRLLRRRHTVDRRRPTTRSSPRRSPRSPRPAAASSRPRACSCSSTGSTQNRPSSCSNGGHRRPTPSCGHSPSKSRGLPRPHLRRGAARPGRLRQAAADRAFTRQILRFIRCPGQGILSTSIEVVSAANSGESGQWRSTRIPDAKSRHDDRQRPRRACGFGLRCRGRGRRGVSWSSPPCGSAPVQRRDRRHRRLRGAAAHPARDRRAGRSC